jgi:hypothetical protein
MLFRVSSLSRLACWVALPFGLSAMVACGGGGKTETKPPVVTTTPNLDTPKPGWGSVPAGITYYGLQAAVVLSEDGTTVRFFAANPTVTGRVNDALSCKGDLDIRGANIPVNNSRFSFSYRYSEHFLNTAEATGSLSGEVVGTIAGDRVVMEVRYNLNATLCQAQGTATVQATRMDDPCAPAVPTIASSSNALVGQRLPINLTATPVFKPLCSKAGAAGTIRLSLSQTSTDASLAASEIAIVDGAGVTELNTGTRAGTVNLVASSPLGTTYDAKASVSISDPCTRMGVTLTASPPLLSLRPGESAKITVDVSLNVGKCVNPGLVPLQMSVPGGIVTIATPDVQVSGGPVTFDVVAATPGVGTVATKVVDPTKRFTNAVANSRIEVNQHPVRAFWQLPSSIAESHLSASALDGDTLYLATDKQLQTVNVLNPYSPVFGPVVTMPHSAYSMRVAGPNLYVGYCDTTPDQVRTVVSSGVLAYRSGPDGLTLLGDVKTCPANSCVSALAVAGDRVVADCDSQNSLQVVDFQTNQVASTLAIGSSYYRAGPALSAAGTVFYLESGYLSSTLKPSKLHALAISDAGAISQVASLQLAQVCWELAASGDKLFASCKDDKGNLVLVVIDVSVPTAPVVLASPASTTRLLGYAMPIVRPNGVFVFAGGQLGAAASSDTTPTISWFAGETPAALTFSAAESALNYRPIGVHGDALIVRFDDNTTTGKRIGVVDLSTSP